MINKISLLLLSFGLSTIVAGSWPTFPDPYFLGPNKLNFTNAENYCISEGGHLASIHSSTVHDYVTNLRDTADWNCWIGIYRKSKNNSWINIDGTKINNYDGFDDNGNAIKGIYPWYRNRPNNIGNCVNIQINTGEYLDVECDRWFCH